MDAVPDSTQDIFQHKKGIQITVAICLLQILIKAVELSVVVCGVYFLLVSGKDGIFSAPCLGPVDFAVRLFAGFIDDILNLLQIDIK